jgi:cation transporter-like permease
MIILATILAVAVFAAWLCVMIGYDRDVIVIPLCILVIALELYGLFFFVFCFR